MSDLDLSDCESVAEVKAVLTRFVQKRRGELDQAKYAFDSALSLAQEKGLSYREVAAAAGYPNALQHVHGRIKKFREAHGGQEPNWPDPPPAPDESDDVAEARS